MSEITEEPLTEIGLPRANSNGLFLFALLVIGVFAVMAFSCDRSKSHAVNTTELEPQSLTGKEWFVGKATGIEQPKAPVAAPEEPKKPKPRQIAARPQKPVKRLGGKIFASTGGSSQKPKAPPAVTNTETTHASFDPARTPPVIRPEYYLSRDLEQPISDFEVKAGTVIPAQLDMGLNSDLGGPAVAHITRRVYDTATGQFLLIPPGTKLYGNVSPNVAFGQTRLEVIWQRLIFPNGASLVLENMRAADRSGQTGLHHTVDNHLGRLYGGAVLLSLISAGV